MVDRLLLSTSQLKVSKPGVDVKTAASTSPDNFLMDSESQNLGILMTGTLSIGNNPPYSGTPTYTAYTLMFPYDLGYIPYVMTHWQLLSGEAFTPPANTESWRYPSPMLTEGDYNAFYVYAFSDRLRYWKWGTAPAQTVRYTVFYAKQGVL